MTNGALIIPLGFIILSTILLWCLIGSKGKWPFKLALIILLPSFGLMVWKSLDSYLGWPTPEKMPEKSILLSSEIREPDPKTGHPGEIYLWLAAFDAKQYNQRGALDYQADIGEPRAHKVPYSRKLHKQLNDAMEMIKNGKLVVMDGSGKSGGEGDGDGKEGAGGKQGKEGNAGKENGGQGDQGNGFSQEQEFRFYELPPPSMPDKNHN